MGGVKKHGMGYVRQIDVCGGRAELRTSPSNLASSTYTICASASVTRNAPSGTDPCGFLLVCTPDAGILAGAVSSALGSFVTAIPPYFSSSWVSSAAAACDHGHEGTFNVADARGLIGGVP